MRNQAHYDSLRAARARAGLTQVELAAKVGLTQPTVSEWEIGQKSPHGSARILLAQVLDVPLDVVNSWFAREEKAA